MFTSQRGGIVGLERFFKGGELVDSEAWLWCLHCERFFQVKDLRTDFCGGKEGCAFEDCNGAGLEVDIFAWDDWAKQNDLKHWPKSTAELRKGLRCPLYPEAGK